MGAPQPLMPHGYGPPPFHPAYYPNQGSAPWMQPGPHRPLPAKRSGKGVVGCLIVAAVLLFIGAPITLIAIGLAVSGDEQQVTKTDPVIVPTVQKPVTPLTPEQAMESAFKFGTCNDYTRERSYPDYAAKRNHGSAHALTGKVLLLHLRLKSASYPWTTAQTRTVENAMILAERYYEDMAVKDGQSLAVDSVVWDVNTSFAPTPFALDTRKLMTANAMRLYRDEARSAAEIGLQKSLSRVVADAGIAKGYNEVAFFIHMPMDTQARDFAFAALQSDNKDYAEAAFIFVPRGRDFGNFSVTIAHEGLHLFGADDLYRIRNIPPEESREVMNAYCTGFGQAVMLDATKYAIGWRKVPPVRPYPFTDW